MNDKSIEEQVGFDEESHLRDFRRELASLCQRYGIRLTPDPTSYQPATQRWITINWETTTCHWDMLKAFVKQSADRIRIYADFCHQTFADNPWYDPCCKGCPLRYNDPSPGDMCAVIGEADEKCNIVKCWQARQKSVGNS